ncbi:hypothetical protein [Novosphingobium gossypii]|uniref:hypothetical protein n=1 Tax=Novosphingobium gossypii TaxID=1604774 RepID=UPI003D210994
MSDKNQGPDDAAIDEALGGVQGMPPAEDTAVPHQPSADAPSDGPSEETPPDAGEIEWARQVVKRPPAPQA